MMSVKNAKNVHFTLGEGLESIRGKMSVIKGKCTCFTQGKGLESIRGKKSVKTGKCKCFTLIVEHDGSFMVM